MASCEAAGEFELSELAALSVELLVEHDESANTKVTATANLVMSASFADF